LYLIKKYFLTTIVVLLTGDEAVNKTTSDARHLPDQGAAALREGCLADQRPGGLGRDVQVVVVPGVQSHLAFVWQAAVSFQ
jgi:hypothetical protein